MLDTTKVRKVIGPVEKHGYECMVCSHWEYLQPDYENCHRGATCGFATRRWKQATRIAQGETFEFGTDGFKVLLNFIIWIAIIILCFAYVFPWIVTCGWNGVRGC